MDDYSPKMKNIVDQLALADASISNDELILHTLNGLDAEYNAIVVKSIDQDGLSWIDAQASLMAFESRLGQLNHLSSLSLQPSTNMATHNSFVPNKNLNSQSGSNSGHGPWRGS
ncbi:hypothetical protein QN277_016927 [Acacia crassicarpa]|uniref:Uncharacterized protein n=1 Tax=Acacia crassicarpa TaxID=499986 RepID=A0AAE1MXJ2_9FABA|nr:hypothetical protein QN277_016927 [Acacia crassicarpa]